MNSIKGTPVRIVHPPNPKGKRRAPFFAPGHCGAHASQAGNLDKLEVAKYQGTCCLCGEERLLELRFPTVRIAMLGGPLDAIVDTIPFDTHRTLFCTACDTYFTTRRDGYTSTGDS